MKKWLKRTLATLCGSVMMLSTFGGLVACKDKGNNNTVNGACQHTFGEAVVTVEATCTTPGQKVQTCTKCSEQRKIVITPAHNYQQSETETVSCLRDGFTTFTCTKCNDSYRNVTARASGHKITGADWEAEDDREKEDCAWEHVWSATCPTCNTKVEQTEDFQKHDWEVSITTVATCSTAGVKTYACKDCDETKEVEYTDANAHNWVQVNEANGVITYECQHATDNCTATKTVFSAKEEVAATVPAAALQEAGEVELKNAAIKMDEAVLNQFNGKDVELSVDTVNAQDTITNPDTLAKLEGAPVFDFNLKTDGDKVSTFNGKMTVTVPYDLPDGVDPDEVTVAYIADDGTLEMIQATYSWNAAEEQGYATFETEHFSLYTVIRLTMEEYCAVYGHKNETTTVEASCNVQGYTSTTCARCHKTERTNYTAALTHDYQTTVVKATCVEKGYTVYECSHCQDKYNSDYVKTIPHNYKADAVVEATCKKDGYTTMKCATCGDSYADKIVAKKPHAYKNGVCTACGSKDPNAATAGNFYFNMMESVAQMETFYVEVKDVKVVTIHEGYAEKVDIELDLARLVLGFDEQGLVGKGEGTMKQKYVETYVSGDVVTEDVVGHVVVVFRDGMMYVKIDAKSATGTIDAMDGYVAMSQEDILMNMFGGGRYEGETQEPEMTPADQVAALLEANAETITKLFAEIAAVTNSPLDKVIGTVTEFFFVKEQTADGYTFTLNRNCINLTYNALSTLTVADLYDTVFGKDALKNTVQYLKDSMNKTIPQFEAEATTELAKWGINKDTLYALIEGFTGQSVSEMLTQMSEMTVLDLFNGMTGAEEPMTAEEIGQMLDGLVASLDEQTALEQIIALVSQAAGPDMEIELPEQGADGEDPILAMINEYLDYLGDSKLTFTTDKVGALQEVSMVFDGVDFTVPSEEPVTIQMNGTVKFIPDGSYAAEYEGVVNEAKKFEQAYAFNNVIETEKYTLFKINGETFLWSNDRYQIYGESDEETPWEDYVSLYKTELSDNKTLVAENETVNGKACNKYETVVANLYRVFYDTMLAESDCTGWFELADFYVSGKAMTEVYVWQTADGEVVKLELKENQNWNKYDGFGSANLFYNPTTGEYASEQQHAYKEVKHVAPDGCTQGYRLYECSVCGNSHKATYGGGHYVTTTAKLDAGATSCEDGVTLTGTCLNCGEKLYEQHVTNHRTAEFKILMYTSEECGDVYLEYDGCACGEEIYNTHVEADCYFESQYVSVHADEAAQENCGCSNHYKDKYVCAIENCDAWYTHEYKHWYTRENDTCYSHTQNIYVFAGGKTFTYSNVYESHDEYSESGYDEATGMRTTKWTCKLCNEVTDYYGYRSDSFGRDVEYKNYVSGRSWIREYDAYCNYTHYEYDENGRVESSHSGTQHANQWWSGNIVNCTQYFYEGHTCRACGYENGNWFAPDRNYHPYDDGHNWYQSNGVWRCRYCDTYSNKGADGPISMEDMGMTEDKTAIEIGWFNFRRVDMDLVDVKFNVNYVNDENLGTEITGEFWTNQITTPPSAYDDRDSGIVSVDVSALVQAIGQTNVDSVWVFFWVPQESVTGGETTMVGCGIDITQYLYGNQGK